MPFTISLPRLGRVASTSRPARPSSKCFRTTQLTRAAPPDHDPLPSDLAGFLSPPSALFDRAAREWDEMDRAFDGALERSFSQEGASSSRDGARTFTERTVPGQSWHREERSERTTPGGGYSRSYRSETVAVWGVTPRALPPPAATTSGSLLSPVVVIAAVAAGAYAAVAAVFARRFEEATTYKSSGSHKARLVALWPILAIFSPAFRENLASAFRADRASRAEAAAAKVAKAAKAAERGPPPAPQLPNGPSQTAGGRWTADSSMLRPDRVVGQATWDGDDRGL